jgi:hypothetical protein
MTWAADSVGDSGHKSPMKFIGTHASMMASIRRPCHGEKMIRPLCCKAEYDAAMEEIERYFENESKPRTDEADGLNRFDLLALVVEDHESMY